METLAHIILKVLHYQPAIDFLKSIGEDDFTGYAGFPESIPSCGLTGPTWHALNKN
jgi:hypothetical protein